MSPIVHYMSAHINTYKTIKLPTQIYNFNM